MSAPPTKYGIKHNPIQVFTTFVNKDKTQKSALVQKQKQLQQPPRVHLKCKGNNEKWGKKESQIFCKLNSKSGHFNWPIVIT